MVCCAVNSNATHKSLEQLYCISSDTFSMSTVSSVNKSLLDAAEKGDLTAVNLALKAGAHDDVVY